MKGITPIIAIIILLLVTIAMAGAAYTYISAYNTGLTSKVIQVQDSFGNTVVISNIGNQPISSDEIFVSVNGDQGIFTTTQTILPGQSASLVIQSYSNQANVEVRVRGPGGGTNGVSFITNLQPAGDTLPAVALNYPPDGASFASGSTVSFNCTGSDTGGGVTNISILGDWGGSYTVIGSQGYPGPPHNPVETAIIPLTINPLGAFNWGCLVKDNATAPQNKTSLPRSIIVTADTTPPLSVIMLNPASGSTLTGCSVAFQCSATDDVNLASMSAYDNISGGTALRESRPAAGTANTTTFTTLAYPTLNYGSYGWYCNATDAAGNVNASQSLSQFTFSVINGNNTPNITAPSLPSSLSKSSGNNLTCAAGSKADLDCTDTSAINTHYAWSCSGGSCGSTPVMALNLPMDEANGTGHITDISGNGLTAQLGSPPGGQGIGFGTAPVLTNGKVGKAYDFTRSPNTNNTIRVLDNSALDFGPSDSFTLEGWIRAELYPAFTSNYTLIDKKGTVSTGPGYWLKLNGFGAGSPRTLVLVLGDGSTRADIGSIATIDDDSTFHHFAAVWDASVGTVRLYIDGVDVSPAGNAYFTVAGFSNAENLYIGTTYTSGTTLLEGIDATLDEIIIWRRALSVEEIKRHAQATPDYSTMANQELASGDGWTCTTVPIDPEGHAGPGQSSGSASITP
ncbi:MAG: LamG domain-containing protein [Candidatus Aenigmarchaeota archaeon]|nr:LamG domain-containing protein [Candidatus Aenigmarchaeota archaeon]